MMRKILILFLTIVAGVIAGSRNYYSILKVAKDADDKTIKKAYRERSKELHPDKNPDDPKAQERFMDLSNAYEVLSDPAKRKVYDTHGEEGLKRQQSQGGGDGSFRDPFSVFEDFFGGGGGGNVRFEFSNGGGFQRQQRKNTQDSSNYYDQHKDVLQWGEQTFSSGIKERDSVVLVKFYLPGCKHCKTLKDEYIKLARDFQGIVPIAAVNCARSEGICEENGITSYPTLQLFPEDKNENAVTYEGERASRNIGAWISTHMPSHAIVLKSKNLEDFLSQDPLLAKVILFTNKRSLSALFKALSREFRSPKRLNIAVVFSSEEELVKRFDPKTFPALLHLTDLDSLTGEWLRTGTNKEALSLSLSRIVAQQRGAISQYGGVSSGGSFKELTERRLKNGECSSTDGQICFILVQFGEKTDMDAKIDSELRDMAKRLQRDPVRFVKVDADRSGAFVDAFGLESSKTCKHPGADGTCSVLVAYKGKRRKFSLLQAEDIVENKRIESFVDGILSGSQLTSKVKSVPTTNVSGKKEEL